MFRLLPLMLVASHGFAADPVVDGSGQLTGATGVRVSGNLYEVDFVDDTYLNIFAASGTDAATSLEGAQFGTALLNQVLVDGITGDFNSSPELTAGCSNTLACNVLIPYDLDGALVTATNVINRRAGSSQGDEIGTPLQLQAASDLGDVTLRVYADFTFTSELGDVNQDGALTLVDWYTLGRSISTGTPLSQSQLQLIDVHPEQGDGAITVSDVFILEKRLTAQ